MKITQLKNVKNISFGWGHIIYQTHEDELFGFACNTSGQIGVGNTKNLFSITQIKSLANKGRPMLVMAGKVKYHEWK